MEIVETNNGRASYVILKFTDIITKEKNQKSGLLITLNPVSPERKTCLLEEMESHAKKRGLDSLLVKGNNEVDIKTLEERGYLTIFGDVSEKILLDRYSSDIFRETYDLTTLDE